MRNGLAFDREDARVGQVTSRRGYQPHPVDDFLDFPTEKQSQGPNFQETFKSFKFNSELFLDSAYFDDSQNISNFVLDFDLENIENQVQIPKRDDSETFQKNQKIAIVNFPSSTQVSTTQSGTAQSSSQIHPRCENPFNSSIEIEANDGMNFPAKESEGDAQGIDLNDGRILEEENKQPEANAERDDESSHSMVEEKEEIETKTKTKRGKSGANKPPSKKRNLPSLFMVAIKRAYKYYRNPKKGKKEFELKSIKRVFDDEKKKVDDKFLKDFDEFMKGCNAKLKTYTMCIKFIDKNESRRVKELFKKFIAYIFKYENKKWLEASGTRNPEFLKELDSFKKNLSLALGIPQ